jgi:hypothetical protein
MAGISWGGGQAAVAVRTTIEFREARSRSGKQRFMDWINLVTSHLEETRFSGPVGNRVAQGTEGTSSADKPVVTKKESFSRRMVSSGMLRRVALVRSDVSEELSASFIRVTRIGELGTTQAATSNRSTLGTSVASCSLCCS